MDLIRTKRAVYRRLGLRHMLIKLTDKTADKETEENRISEGLKPKRAVFTAENTISEEYDLKIVLPVYNDAKYVEQCMESVLKQKTEYRYLIHLIDDGSDDGSLEIIAKYGNLPNVEIVHIEHGGVAVSRNVGLKNLNAKYVMFVDGDDALYDENVIQKLLSKAFKEDADIVEGNTLDLDTGTMHSNHIDGKVDRPCGTLWGGPTSKVIRSSLFRDICFPEGFYFEDIIMAYLIYTGCSKVYTIRDKVYRYRNNPKGSSKLRTGDMVQKSAAAVLLDTISEMQVRGIPIDSVVYAQLIKSMITGCVRLMYAEDNIRRDAVIRFGRLLENLGMDGTQDEYDAIFEKAIRKRQYRKITKLCYFYD